MEGAPRPVLERGGLSYCSIWACACFHKQGVRLRRSEAFPALMASSFGERVEMFRPPRQ